MNQLTLSDANTIVTAALQHARAHNMHAMTVAVLDAGGHLIAFQREDSSAILRPQIAMGKAWGVLGVGVGGRELARRAESHPAFFGALSDASGGRIFPVPGGVLIRNKSGHVVGSAGISGDLPQLDEACAIAGIAAAGLESDPG